MKFNPIATCLALIMVLSVPGRAGQGEGGLSQPQRDQAKAALKLKIADQYIVLLKNNSSQRPADVARAQGLVSVKEFKHAISGFLTRITNPKVLEALRRNPNVQSVEVNGVV